MVSVLGYLLPSNKLISIGLTRVYGINRSRASQICNSLGFAKDLRVKDLRDSQLRDLLNYLSTCNFKLGAELRREETSFLQSIIENGSYRGYRHRLKLPVRGQRTRTNSITQRRLAGSRLKLKN